MTTGTATRRSTVKSAERALEVLSFLSASPSPVPAATIARNVGLPKSSMYHLLNVMLDRGYVAHFSEEGTWGLGPVARHIGTGQQKHGFLLRLARPLMVRLSGVTGLPALLAVLYGSEALVIERIDPPGGYDRRGPVVGERTPAHATAWGRALLMEESPGTVRSLYPSGELPALTPRGPRRWSELSELLVRSRARGYAVEAGELVPGAEAVAAPVLDHLGYVASAIGVTHWGVTLDGARLGSLADTVRRSASGLSVRLGYRHRGSAS